MLGRSVNGIPASALVNKIRPVYSVTYCLLEKQIGNLFYMLHFQFMLEYFARVNPQDYT